MGSRHHELLAGPSIYLDELSIAAAFRLIRLPGRFRVTVLEGTKFYQTPCRWLLNIFGVTAVEATFFEGDLRTNEGEAVGICARRLAGEIAMIASKQIVYRQCRRIGGGGLI